MLVFSEAEKSGEHELAVILAGRLGSTGMAVEKCTSLVAVGAGILLIVAILRGNTCLKKSAVVFSPIVLMLVVIAVSQALPRSAFSYGLYMFNMNAAMMVWFTYLLAVGSITAKSGRLGCVFMGSGDWLMMYGSTAYHGNLYWLTEGVAQIPAWRNSLSMLVAFPAHLVQAFQGRRYGSCSAVLVSIKFHLLGRDSRSFHGNFSFSHKKR